MQTTAYHTSYLHHPGTGVYRSGTGVHPGPYSDPATETAAFYQTYMGPASLARQDYLPGYEDSTATSSSTLHHGGFLSPALCSDYYKMSGVDAASVNYYSFRYSDAAGASNEQDGYNDVMATASGKTQPDGGDDEGTGEGHVNYNDYVRYSNEHFYQQSLSYSQHLQQLQPPESLMSPEQRSDGHEEQKEQVEQPDVKPLQVCSVSPSANSDHNTQLHQNHDNQTSPSSGENLSSHHPSPSPGDQSNTNSADTAAASPDADVKSTTDTSSLTKEEGEQDKQSNDVKPTLSYIALIAKSILESPHRRLNLGSIYGWIEHNFPYYKDRGQGWRNSVRHNLSLNDCFIKAGRCEDGKGNYWAIHPANLHDFLRGDFRQRRRSRRRGRKNTEAGLYAHGLLGSTSGMTTTAPVSFPASSLSPLYSPYTEAERRAYRLDEAFHRHSTGSSLCKWYYPSTAYPSQSPVPEGYSGVEAVGGVSGVVGASPQWHQTYSYVETGPASQGGYPFHSSYGRNYTSPAIVS